MPGFTTTDDLVWFDALEMSLELRGTWSWEIIPAPPFPLLIAECQDAPIALEVYPMDPEKFRSAYDVGRDLVQSRLARSHRDEILGDESSATVQAEGTDNGRPTRLYGQVTHDHDAYYVIAFSGPPHVVEAELWRLDAILGSAHFGVHRAHGRGVRGLLNLVESRVSESDVPVGYSRSQLGTVRGRGVPWDLGPMKRRKPHFTERGAAWIGEKITGQSDAHTQATTRGPSFTDALDARIAADDFDDFEERLTTPGSQPSPAWRDRDGNLGDFEARLMDASQPLTRLRWPAPWEPLGNNDPDRGQLPRSATPPGFKNRTRDRRELEVVAFTQSLGADLALYAEKIVGVGERLALREGEPFSVYGLDRLPLVVEALLRVHQGELDAKEPLPIGPPRRCFSPLGRQVPDDHAVPLDAALRALVQEDDATAADLLGWTLGWRDVQERLPLMGLAHHTNLIPNRARMLAFTNLEGAFDGLDLNDRADYWRSLDDDMRRGEIGQLHRAHANTPLDEIANAFMEVVHDASIPLQHKARWSLALGPRGTAREYAELLIRAARGQLLAPALSHAVLSALKPCLGDPLSGALHGVPLSAGKLGQDFGCLNVVGLLGTTPADQIGVCVLIKNIQTTDYSALVEQLHTLGRLVHQLILDT